MNERDSGIEPTEREKKGEGKSARQVKLENMNLICYPQKGGEISMGLSRISNGQATLGKVLQLKYFEAGGMAWLGAFCQYSQELGAKILLRTAEKGAAKHSCSAAFGDLHVALAPE